MPKNNRSGQSKLFSDNDYVKLLRQIKNPKHRLFLQIARYSGERWGAITQLHVSDLYADPAKRTPASHITFRAATRKASPNGERRTRQLKICDQLAQELKAYAPPLEGWLFQNALKPATHISFQSADDFLRLAIERAGIGDGYSTHSTRRTFITTLSRAGVALPVIKSITGHTDAKSLLKYIEVSDEQITNALAVL
ncbi:site-specific integrase [Microcoleus sp. FACHB-68]|uniref:tyrosine-type recombinase/integrase n=1 Tax=Microcoleus sp. FACHB-68 TaxID=2692826 RepID=UPI00168791E3|nr:site-specific integrase [Microcoleus sp. FACHB-68]MBD1939098.1 site-specific integrase [Microcoleus sp. FACHB-68]